MKRLLLLVLTLGCVATTANSVNACVCDEYGTPVCAQYWRADAVFVAQVRDITSPDRESGENWPTAILHLIVEQTFRGITTSTVDVRTLSGTSCDMKFEKGRRYLFYAARVPNELFAGPCMGTTSLEQANDDLNYIRSLAQQGAESISGRVTVNRFEAVPDVKIQIQSDTRTFETTSDERGDFSVAVARPGTYTVRLLIPSPVGVLPTRENPNDKVEASEAFTTIEYKVELGKNQCNYRQLVTYPVDLRATAEISGTVMTPSGVPVDKGSVHLVRVENDHDYDHEKIEADGSFRFNGVAAGEYFLVLNPKDEAPGASDAPYGRAYYANATEKKDATKILVTEGARLGNLILRVGPALKEKTVSGRVVWRDGGPAAKARVSLYDANRYIQTIEADEEGGFSFEIYGDFEYVLEAQVWSEKRPGKSARVVLAEKSTNLTLVLKPQ